MSPCNIFLMVLPGAGGGEFLNNDDGNFNIIFANGQPL
jgi:hypothetical protein